MKCKKGGLVLLRHNEVQAEWSHLCKIAHTASYVTDEPLIHSSQDRERPVDNAAEKVDPELRGDVGVHGFWKRGQTTIFDIRVTDTNASSNRGLDPKKVLKRHEKEKKGKYLAGCLARRRSFTPLVFSVDGLHGAEAKAAGKRLAASLSARWNRPYSEVCGYVRSRLAIALVRSASMCLRGARDPTARASHSQWETGAGLGLYNQ